MKISYGEEFRSQFENLTTAQRTASPALKGRKVYDTDLDRPFVGDGTNWKQIPISDDLSTEYLESNFISNIKEATANTGLTDNSNTNPLELKFSDLRYRAGRTRIEVYSIELTDEYIDNRPTYKISAGCGPKGFRDQVRFVGETWYNYVDSSVGPLVRSTNDTDYILVTGLMDDFAFLAATNANYSDDLDIQVDGVDTGTNLSVEYSPVLNTYNIRPNTIISDTSIGTAISSYGLHTIKIINGDSGSNYDLRISGFELITTTPREQAGDAFVGITENNFSAQDVTDPTFSNTMGGVSHRYIDPADNIRKWASREGIAVSTTLTSDFNFGTNSMTVADSSNFLADYLVEVEDTSLGYTISEIFLVSSIGGATNITVATSASRTDRTGTNHNFASGSVVRFYGKVDSEVDHEDEQIQNNRHPRCFGAGHADDFNNLTTAADARSFILDDGSNGLWGNDVRFVSGSQLIDQTALESDDDASGGNNIVIIFNGTGIDLDINVTDSVTRAADIYLDNVLIKSYNNGGSAARERLPLVSNLPNGTHVLRINASTTGGVNTPGLVGIVIYQPKQNTIIDTVDIGNIISKKCFIADYIFNSGSSLDDISKGVSLYAPNRGWRLLNSSTAWLAGANANFPFYKFIQGQYNTTNAEAEYWFFGTGFELSIFRNTDVGIHVLELDGSSDFSSFTDHQSSTAFTKGTGALDGYAASSDIYKVGVTGITLGWHKLKVIQGNSKNGSSTNFYVNIAALGIIGGFACITEPTQSLQQISSCLIGDSLDLRKTKALESEGNVVNFNKSIGITSSPSTTSTVDVPVTDMSSILKTSGNPVKITLNASVVNTSTGQYTTVSIYRNGILEEVHPIKQTGSSNGIAMCNSFILYNIPAGIHVFTAYFKVSANTGIVNDNLTSRIIEAVELTGVKNEN